jgi:hypothetical protein
MRQQGFGLISDRLSFFCAGFSAPAPRTPEREEHTLIFSVCFFIPVMRGTSVPGTFFGRSKLTHDKDPSSNLSQLRFVLFWWDKTCSILILTLPFR